jgi:ABC-type Mn2+/Zn2+ transport system permease subunit
MSAIIAVLVAVVFGILGFVVGLYISSRLELDPESWASAILVVSSTFIAEFIGLSVFT